MTEHWASDLREPDAKARHALRPTWGDADLGMRLVVLDERDGALCSQKPTLIYDRKIGLARLPAQASEP